MKFWTAACLALAAGIAPGARAQDQLPLPTATINYAAKPPRIDGKLDDAVWRDASPLNLDHTSDGKSVTNAASARLAWDEKNLYVAFDVPDERAVAGRLGRDGLIFERDDVMELFLWPREDQPYYYEIVVNPRGTIYDAFLVSKPDHQGPDLSLPDWSPDISAAGQLTPSILYRPDKVGEAQAGGRWTSELAIPLSALSNRGAAPPVAGETWRVQVNRYNRPDPAPGELDATAWSPYYRTGWPHLLDRFGKITFFGSAAPPPPVIPPVIPESGAAMATPSPAPVASPPTPTPAPPVSPPPAPAPTTPAPDNGTPATPPPATPSPATPTPDAPAPGTPAPGTPASPSTPQNGGPAPMPG